MFRLSSMKLTNWRQACRAANLVQTQAADMGSKPGKVPPNKPKDPNAAAAKKDKKPDAKKIQIEEDKTPAGQKKDMAKPMLDAYHPKQVEAAWYSWWEAQKYFHPKAENVLDGKKKPYVMILPPPNVTGALHLGHALMLAIEDAIMRWRRMSGYEVLWLPGCDHAGIATQSVVEKQLWKKEKKTRHDLGREKFVESVWNWKEEYGNRISLQFRRMGICVDWDRFLFTMDPQNCKAVTESFVRLHEKGLIYRDTRLVNWSSHLRTALSDLEVEYIELKGPTFLEVPGHDPNQKYEFGALTEFGYKVKGTDKTIVVATTRLETMLGDVAVAVHSEDPRYKDFVGKELEHPFCPERKIVMITDDTLVDMNYGTGAVKITPAHDHNDNACGRRHNLPMINVLDETGRINHEGGALFQGMMRFEARNAIYAELDKRGLIFGKKPNPMRIGRCSKSNDIIEPLLKPQWYVNCKNMAARSCDAVRNKELLIVPDSHEKTWFMWLDNIQDWCISRQLWWGHRIPAYLVKIPGLIDHPDKNNNEHWVVGHTKETALAAAAAKFKVPESQITLEQDEDVLDTWFSSGLLPFSTMGWPDNDKLDMRAFFPGDLLETGHDILFFWVARMVMMSLELTDKLPFTTVYLHPMVRDEEGAKMSKSKGNVIDPLEVMDSCTLDVLLQKLYDSNLPEVEVKKAVIAKSKDFPQGIPECGTDALRFALLSYMVQSSINLDVKRVIGYREFCNKLWNIVKFALGNFPADFKPNKDGITQHLQHLSLADRWILHHLNELVESTNKHFTNYKFGDMVNGLYDFWYKEVAAVYLEAIKPVMKSDHQAKKDAALNTLYIVLDAALKMLHPTMPYVTEELYQRLPHHADLKSESICIADFP